jgi:hypothetical protein
MSLNVRAKVKSVLFFNSKQSHYSFRKNEYTYEKSKALAAFEIA